MPFARRPSNPKKTTPANKGPTHGHGPRESLGGLQKTTASQIRQAQKSKKRPTWTFEATSATSETLTANPPSRSRWSSASRAAAAKIAAEKAAEEQAK